MKKKFRIKAKNINTGKLLDKVCHSSNISCVVSALGNYGWMVQEYYEVDGDNGNCVIQLNLRR